LFANLSIGESEFLCKVHTGNTYWTWKFSTVDHLINTGCFAKYRVSVWKAPNLNWSILVGHP
jgi:hypothetical protein